MKIGRRLNRDLTQHTVTADQRLDRARNLVLKQERENERLREAIADALADLTPGVAPYALLDDALRHGQKGGSA